VFGEADGTKRFSPGKATRLRPDERVFEHDCSTLSGNSGSCALDFDRGRALGLHYGGIKPDASGVMGESNLCVALAALHDHPLRRLLAGKTGANHG
jgi:V8-like Glu-specific endopeptidase